MFLLGISDSHMVDLARRAMNPVVRGDILVSDFLDSVGGYRHKERRDHLLDILDVDLDWRMHQISDGAFSFDRAGSFQEHRE